MKVETVAKLSKYELRKKVEKLLHKVSELEKSNEILRSNLMEKDKKDGSVFQKLRSARDKFF
jgi:hypothetical protein